MRKQQTSHPAWGAWIEMGRWGWPLRQSLGRTPHGVRGLKFGYAQQGGMFDVAPRMGCVD